MAKKVLYHGDLLKTDDWGGPITKEGVTYTAAAGDAVQNYIKGVDDTKVGYVGRGQKKEEGGFYYLYGFIDESDYNKWKEDPTSTTPLFRTSLPNADTYEVKLTTSSSTTKLVNLGDGVKIKIRYTSVSIDTSGTRTDTDDEGRLIIQRSYGGSSFTTVGQLTIQPQKYESTDEQEVDITSYLLDGDNMIRIRVEDTVNGSVSGNVTFNSVVNTSLVIENALDISKPLSTAEFSYYIQGQIAKSIHINVTDPSGNEEEFVYSLGESIYTETPYKVNVGRVYETGTLTVEAWLTVDDTTLESTHITNQFYYINGTSTESVIILNNQASTVTNYTNTKFFDFVVYNYSSDVNIVIKNGTTTYLTYKYTNVPVNTKYEFYNTLEIESESKTLSATVSVSTKDMTKTFDITIDNSENMNPTSGASFILNPKIRSNTETNRNTIINSVTSSTVSSTWTGFDFNTDGWLADSDGVRLLRIPANHKIEIDYDPLDDIAEGTTIELDYKVYNTFSDSDTIITMNSYSGSDMLGFKMTTTEAYVLTNKHTTMRDQDVVFQDETKTHLAINIIPNLYGQGFNYVRLFVNGIMNREFMYTDDIFKLGTVKIVLGGMENCDLDIYSIRVYKKSLSASDVRQDYLSSIPKTEDKLIFKEANNILAADGTISYDKAAVMYNTLIWTGQDPEYYNQGADKTAGTLTVNILNDPSHSGSITNLQIKGQGSSSKGYWKWNHQYDMGKIKSGKKDESGNDIYLDSVWTDGNGEEHLNYYLLDDDCPKMQKMVAKLNWASSMQSHKIGSTALYNDLWKKLIGSGITRTAGYEKVRVAVHEKPFLYFIRETESDVPVFHGLMTFGSGKADKQTFGYDKSKFPNYMLIEGSDNGMPLPLRQVPWIDDDVTYNADEEYYEYAGQGQFDFDMGNQDSVIYFKNAINFTFLHSHRLKYYTTLDGQANWDTSYQYWCAIDGDDKYKVKRYDFITNTWVDAGIEKLGTGSYSVLNIVTQTEVDPSGYSDLDVLNEAFIAKRKEQFKSGISSYYNVSDVLFSLAFVKLVAASDNWCKNTYEYYDPVDCVIRMAQDDLDTILLTDNVGRKTKPYYVEEHDKNSEGTYYWNGETNTFFNLMESCFSTELHAMMKSILDTMRSSDFGGNAWTCLQNYYFYVQEYFPAVAYNETSRLLYEEAAYHQNKPDPDYVNGTPAISQSLGDQLQAEKQWWKRRLPYMQSWSSSYPFAAATRDNNSLFFRSMTHADPSDPSVQVNPTYIFKLTPWQWLYPKAGVGQSVQADNTRVQSGSTYDTIEIRTDGNTDTFIFGANYYTNFGEFAGQSLGETFNLTGSKLLKFSADSSKVLEGRCYFRPTAITVNCASLKELNLNGISTIEGDLDLTNESKLQKIVLTGTNVKSVTLPETYTLTDVYLPQSGLTGIKLLNCANINEDLLDDGISYANVLSITTDNSWFFKRAMQDAGSNLQTINLTDIEVDYSTSETYSNYMYNVLVNSSSSCTGHVKLKKELTITEKDKLIQKYNSIDDPNGALYIEYTIKHGETGTLTGDSTIALGKSTTIVFNYDGNDVTKYTWCVEGAETYTVGNRNVIVVAPSESSAIGKSITVSCTPTFVSEASYTVTKTINIIDAIYVDSISVDNMYVDAQHLKMTIHYTPENYTIKGKSITAKVGENLYVGISSYDYNNINFTIEGKEPVTSSIEDVGVDVTFTDVEDRVKTASAKLYVNNPITEWYINDTKVN